MRDKINHYWEVIQSFDAYCWFLIAVIAVSGFVIIELSKPVFYWFMRKAFKLERCKWIKGWKRINPPKQ